MAISSVKYAQSFSTHAATVSAKVALYPGCPLGDEASAKAAVFCYVSAIHDNKITTDLIKVLIMPL